MNPIAKHILVKGQVQGVFFRKSTRQVAEALNITGWVKNTEEGNVEIFAQGSREEIAQLIEWCKEGPPRAEVEDVEVKDAKPDDGAKRFLIAY
jgi:acylphosphatase